MRTRAGRSTAAAEEAIPPVHALRQDPLLHGRLDVRAQTLDLVAREREMHFALEDRGDALGRHVALAAEDPAVDVEAVEDVGVVVAGDLVHRSDRLALGVDHLPAVLDHRPGDRIGHGYVARPPRYQTGPCVPTGCVSDITRRIRSSPLMFCSSSRSKHRRTIDGAAP